MWPAHVHTWHMREAGLVEWGRKEACRKARPQQQRCPAQTAHTLSSLTASLLHRAQPRAVLYSPTTGSWWVGRCHTRAHTGRLCSRGLLTLSTTQCSDLCVFCLTSPTTAGPYHLMSGWQCRVFPIGSFLEPSIASSASLCWVGTTVPSPGVRATG